MSVDNNWHEAIRITSILTVGDGDLTLSLAIIRAYGTSRVALTASTLLGSKEELTHTYHNSFHVLNELLENDVSVLFGVDATQLHRTLSNSRFDFVLFHHPHLGLETLIDDEEWHAQRHYILLAHYLWSAKQILNNDGMVHLCLCGSQPQTWNILKAATRQRLELITNESTSIPMHTWMLPDANELPVKSYYPAPRKFRNGKLGSKHALGKYGYQHRRTHGDACQGGDISVPGSIHLVFRSADHLPPVQNLSLDGFECIICGGIHDSQEALDRHMLAPALPDALPITDSEGSSKVTAVSPSKQLQGQGEISGREDTKETVRVRVENVAIAQRAITNKCAEQCHSIVAKHLAGKRLRWYLRQPTVMTLKHCSKKECDELIKEGRVFVNSKVATDSSRILSDGDIVTVVEACITPSVTSHLNKSSIEIVFQDQSLVVALKPVGMRTIGSFSETTMEMTISSLIGLPYKSISKLDTGCSGLCVLQRHDSIDVAVTHIFVALVHGQVPDEWTAGIVLDVPVASMRRWKRSSDNTKRSLDDFSSSECSGESVGVLCLEQTATLSTLQIKTSSKSAGLCNAICFLLRKKGHPVVNDHFCKQEYLELPRSMRNLIKGRLCIGCYEVMISGKSDTIKETIPERMSARYWEQHCKQIIDSEDCKTDASKC